MNVNKTKYVVFGLKTKQGHWKSLFIYQQQQQARKSHIIYIFWTNLEFGFLQAFGKLSKADLTQGVFVEEDQNVYRCSFYHYHLKNHDAHYS